MPGATRFIFKTLNNFQFFGISLITSDCVDYFDVGSFATIMYPITTPLFQFLRSFKPIIWFLLFIFIIALSFISSLFYGGFHQFFEYLWNFSNILYSKSLQHLFERYNSKIILGIWLLSALQLGIGFTSYMMDHMIKANNLRKIDDLEQLANEKQMYVYGRTDSPFGAYILEDKESDIANNIRPRFISTDIFDDVRSELLTRLRNGTAAFVNSRLNLITTLSYISQKENIESNQDRLVDIMHISKHSNGFDPYFLTMTTDVEAWVTKALNNMQDHF